MSLLCSDFRDQVIEFHEEVIDSVHWELGERHELAFKTQFVIVSASAVAFMENGPDVGGCFASVYGSLVFEFDGLRQEGFGASGDERIGCKGGTFVFSLGLCSGAGVGLGDP